MKLAIGVRMNTKILFSITTILILFSAEINIGLKAQVIEQDSLALVAFYDSTNGAGWTNKENWLTSAVSDWYGIRTENNRVTEVELISNNLIGRIPAEIKDLDSLKTLSVGRNNLAGVIPLELFGLLKLENLYLDHNEFEGEIPAAIANLEKLLRINLGSNVLSGELPPELFTMTQLTYFEVYSNELTGEIPPEIGNLTKLTILSLSNNEFSGEILNYLINMPFLRKLFLQNNNFTGIIPDSIDLLSGLNHFNAAGNIFSGELPPHIGNLPTLNFLHLGENNFTGPIPKEIGDLSNLETLYLYRNQFNDTIPKEIGNLSKLKILYLSENELTSVIPALDSLKNLEQLYLQNNNLEGIIPVQLTELTNIKRLYLEQNNFSGAIPPEIINLSNLEDLQLFNNSFDDLPNLSSLSLLQELEIQNNRFTFEDIEPNIEFPYCSYDPQDSIGNGIDTILTNGESLTLSVDVGGTANSYQWMLDGVDISEAKSNTLLIDSAVVSHSGTYVCKITNSICTELTLYSRKMNITVGNVVDVLNSENKMPTRFELLQNYPNPFNPSTTIKYTVPTDEKRETKNVKLIIYDILGREVATLVNQKRKPGNYEITWDAMSQPSGIYLYRLISGEFIEIKKMIIIK